MGDFIQTYKGETQAWEADDLGHMNMRFYFARAAEARAVFFAKLGLVNVYKTEAFSTLVPIRQHIKYHKEVRPGQGLAVGSGILHCGATEMKLLHKIFIPGAPKDNTVSEDVLAATLIETISHNFASHPRRFCMAKTCARKCAGLHGRHVARGRAAQYQRGRKTW